jgi:hypothetical protein
MVGARSAMSSRCGALDGGALDGGALDGGALDSAAPALGRRLDGHFGYG